MDLFLAHSSMAIHQVPIMNPKLWNLCLWLSLPQSSSSKSFSLQIQCLCEREYFTQKNPQRLWTGWPWIDHYGPAKGGRETNTFTPKHNTDTLGLSRLEDLCRKHHYVFRICCCPLITIATYKLKNPPWPQEKKVGHLIDSQLKIKLDLWYKTRRGCFSLSANVLKGFLVCVSNPC